MLQAASLRFRKFLQSEITRVHSARAEPIIDANTEAIE
jgi:hypothetical protein